MHQIDTSSNVSSLPTPLPASTPGFFGHGNPATGSQFTVLSSDWANAVQQEIVNVIQAAALTLDKTSQTQLLQAMQILGRIRLTAPLTLYVATTGSDTLNTGLTSGSPFLTPNHAIQTLQNQYDLAGFNAIIQLANGTYAGPITCGGSFVGAINQVQVTLQGNLATPSAVVISAAANTTGLSLPQQGSLTAAGVTFTGTTGSTCIAVGQNGLFDCGTNVVFGACTGGTHISVVNGGAAFFLNNYSITGGAANHIVVTVKGWLSFNTAAGQVVTISGTPAFGNFIVGADQGLIFMTHGFTTFSGSATGPRYNISSQALIDTAGGGSTYLPGSTVGAGSGTNGALYI